MNAIGRWSVGGRLAAAFALLLLLFLAFVATLHDKLETNGVILRDQSQRVTAQVIRADALERAVLEMSIAFRSYLLEPDPALQRRYEAQVAIAREVMTAYEAQARDPEVRRRFALVKPLFDRYAAATAAAMAAPAGADAKRVGEIREALLAQVKAVVDAQHAASDAAIALVLANRQAVVDTLRMLAAITALALLAIGTAVTLSIQRPARRLVAVARSLEKGDWRPALALPADAGGSRDEMQRIAAAFGAAARALEAREQALREANERIGGLLAEVRARNDEIAAQNEELQAQNEEIQAQAEELQAQGQKLSAQNDDLRGQSRQLHEQAQALERTDARKNEFLGILAHELRNPLAPLTNGLALIQQLEPGSERFTRAVGIMDRQLRHLSRLVDDLLDVTRISHGKIMLHKAPFDLAKMLADTLADMRPAIEAGGITAHLVLPEAPVTVSGDRTRLHQVVGNLLGNAIKFTPPGGTITVTLASDAASARVSVADTGIGMEPVLLQRLFQPFAQGDSEPARKAGGLGLGLALARALVTMHGGTIEARSDGPGRGAELAVCLPLATGDAPAVPSERNLTLSANRDLDAVE